MKRTFSVWRVLDNSEPPTRGAVRAVVAFYEMFRTGMLDEFFDGEESEWIVIKVEQLTDEAYSPLFQNKTDPDNVLVELPRVVAEMLSEDVNIHSETRSRFRKAIDKDENEPTCPGPDCQMCSGEYCAKHFTDPCDCDSMERHGDR